MDKKEKLYKEWKEEEKIANIKGWDFSHISGRYIEEDKLPWDFKAVIKKYLSNDMKLLDMETGGGEFLLELNHPHQNTSAIEGYKPNVDFCKEKLLPLGIDFREADGKDILPFNDLEFDIITNRHGDYTFNEINRILKENGLFLTQQVGAENDLELINLLLYNKTVKPQLTKINFPEQFLYIKMREFEKNGFEILESKEVYQPIKFYDVGALVWYAKIIEWEFPNFEVDRYLDNLYKAQEILEKNGVIEGQIHRFYFVAKKIK